MSRAAQRARMDAYAERELAKLPTVAMPDMVTTERLAKWGREHLASLPVERRAELENDWETRSCA